LRNSDGLKKLWTSIRANAKALAWMVAAWVVIGGLAYAASRIWWRDDVPRSLIGAGALVLCVIAALAIFGVQGPKTLVATLAAFGAVVAVGGGTVKVGALLSDGPPQEGAVVNCPPTSSDQVRNGFVADTDLGYSLLRSEPNLSSHVLLRYPPGCQLQFTAYCVGEPKTDWRFHDPDPVWFYALGDFHNGYIPAADIRAGPPPGSLPPGQCEGGEKTPARPEITSPLKRTIKGPIEITAAAPGASEVGFAAYYEDRPGQKSSAAWHQLGVDVNTGDGVSSNWDTRSIPGQSLRSPAALAIAAVPCLGLDYAFARGDHVVAGLRRYVVANRGGPTPRQLSPSGASMAETGEVACNNEGR
jgi:hypothetical protein